MFLIFLNYYLLYVTIQARGLKKHLKRLNAPKHWMLDKLGGAFVSFGEVLCSETFVLFFFPSTSNA